jgi:hypothetical protein
VGRLNQREHRFDGVHVGHDEALEAGSAGRVLGVGVEHLDDVARPRRDDAVGANAGVEVDADDVSAERFFEAEREADADGDVHLAAGADRLPVRPRLRLGAAAPVPRIAGVRLRLEGRGDVRHLFALAVGAQLLAPADEAGHVVENGELEAGRLCGEGERAGRVVRKNRRRELIQGSVTFCCPVGKA